MHEKVIEETKDKIEQLLDQGLEENIDDIYKLIDIHKDAYEIEKLKEEIKMYGEYGNYGNYSGRGPSRGSYGRGNYGEYGEGSYGEYGRGSYGRRGRDMRYRGDDSLDRMYGEYGRYQESRQRYGDGEESDKSFHYMVKALEDFIKVLYEEADNQQQKQQLAETLQRSMMM